MGETRQSTSDYDPLRLIAKRLREDSATVTHEPLPKRWVDLIRYLNEQERQQSEAESRFLDGCRNDAGDISRRE
jgi:hypothetical protein